MTEFLFRLLLYTFTKSSNYGVGRAYRGGCVCCGAFHSSGAAEMKYICVVHR